MAVYKHRGNSVLRINADGLLVPAAGYFVQVLEPGGIIQSGSGVTYTLEAGHGLATLDKIIVGTDVSTFRGVTISGNTMTLSGSITPDLAVGAVIINLGPDTGGLAPLWDGSGAAIYSDSDGGTADTDETLTTDAEGKYGYWFDATQGAWELVRNGSTPVAYEIDVFKVGETLGFPASSTDNALVRWDGATGRAIQDYTSNAPTVSDTGAMVVPSTLDVDGAADFDSTINVAGAATLQTSLAVGAAATVATTLGVTGFATLSSGVSIGANVEKTIASGVIDVSGALLVSFVHILPESGTTDNLDTITAGASGQIVVLRNSNAANTITIRQGVGGNITLKGSNITINAAGETAALIYTGTVWIPLTSQI